MHTGQVVMEEPKRDDSAHFQGHPARLKRHPRIVPHYTPKHASWLNQVENFFSLPARAVLRHGDFFSRTDLLTASPAIDCGCCALRLEG
ncbi:hypothetical protein [Streptomyces sp. NPDC051000]|uniref:hypothetical protein n=1 Tax=Streptomyces sp. NPDC051000 TaxID=3155520 RepID=UPI0033C7F196